MILNELFKDETSIKTAYVSRKVLNHEAVRDWAEENGFPSTLPVDDLHVTIAYSKEKFDWSTTEPDEEIIYIEPSDDRQLHVFDGGATVIHFTNEALTQRWQALIDLGASNSYKTYKAHITVTYTGKPKKAVPYPGEIVLGPEVWKEIDNDWKSDMVEQKFSRERP
jgi:hypothetical protein